MWCVRGFPACAPYGNEKLQEPLGRKRSLGPVPFGRVHSDDARAAPLTADLWLETQSVFWVLHPGAVIGTQTNVQEGMKSMVWRAKKDQLDVTTRRIWPGRQWSKRGRHTREYVLNDFWHTFVDDRPFFAEARITETNTQSKAVFSYVMTVMDKVDGWEDEQKWVGSKFAACMWIYTKAVLCDGQASTQDDWWRRLFSIMESVNWVCEEACEEHEWVSELTVFMQEEEILVALNYRIDVLCVVQRGVLLFSVPSRLNQRFEGNSTECTRYKDVTHLATTATFTAPCGAFNTPRACMLRSVAAALERAPDKGWDVGREMIGWGLADGPVLMPDDGDDETDISDE